MNDKKKRVTLLEIAQAAGVSLGTAAKVLSGAGGSAIRVGKETSARVTKLAAELDYQPNHTARILAGKSSNIIGILIDSMAPLSHFRVLSAIEQEFSKLGYRVMIAEAHDNVKSFADSCQTLQQYGVEGIISLAHDYPNNEELLWKYFQYLDHIVFVDKPCFETNDYVAIDRESGIIDAYQHLWNKGRRQIGIGLFNNESRPILQRRDAFLKAAQQHGIVNAEQFVIFVPFSPVESNVIAIADFMRKKQLDAVITPDDFHAVALISELMRRNVAVPEAAAVIGYDNEKFASLVTPRLTTIDENSTDQAVAAVKLLKRIIAGEMIIPQPPEVKNNLIVRDSA